MWTVNHPGKSEKVSLWKKILMYLIKDDRSKRKTLRMSTYKLKDLSKDIKNWKESKRGNFFFEDSLK